MSPTCKVSVSQGSSVTRSPSLTLPFIEWPRGLICVGSPLANASFAYFAQLIKAFYLFRCFFSNRYARSVFLRKNQIVSHSPLDAVGANLVSHLKRLVWLALKDESLVTHQRCGRAGSLKIQSRAPGEHNSAVVPAVT